MAQTAIHKRELNSNKPAVDLAFARHETFHLAKNWKTIALSDTAGLIQLSLKEEPEDLVNKIFEGLCLKLQNSWTIQSKQKLLRLNYSLDFIAFCHVVISTNGKKHQ